MDYKNHNNALIPINKFVFTEEEREFQNECLEAHNMFRAMHGSPPLKLCDQLCSYATNWAMELAEYEELIYSPTNTLGENLYMAAGVRVSGSTPVRAWYNEERDYDYKLGRFSPYTGHFTQIVWKDTREIGVGIVHTDSSFIVVCSYYPAGNEPGAFKANVSAPRKNISPYDEDGELLEYNPSSRNNRMRQNSRHISNTESQNNRRNKPSADDEVTLFFLGILLAVFVGALIMIKA